MSKEPHQWTEDDLLSLISNKAQESLTLDFKGCGALRDKGWRREFAKDVSAFANAAGGTLIYGLKESRATHEAEEIDGGFDPAAPSKEQLEQIINSSVHRRIDGVRYNAIALNRTRPGKVAYVISIPESSHAPHMAHHRFYKRFEFQSVAMEEFEVREKYRRETYPSKGIVRAWFDDGINPLLAELLSEERSLNNERWAWNHLQESFSGLDSTISTRLNRSANQDDFLERYPKVQMGLIKHDRAVKSLDQEGQAYFNEIVKSPSLRNLVKRATSIRALRGLKAEHLYKLTGKTKEELMGQIFGNEGVNANTLAWLAEYSMNQRQMLQNDLMMPFWAKYRELFFQIPMKRPFTRKRSRLVAARAELSKINQTLISSLEQTRKALSEEHGVPFEESQRTVYEPHPFGLGGIYR